MTRRRRLHIIIERHAAERAEAVARIEAALARRKATRADRAEAARKAARTRSNDAYRRDVLRNEMVRF
jgi:hypothetical protein